MLFRSVSQSRYGVRMIMSEIPVSYEEASALLEEHGSVRKAVTSYQR